MTPKGLRGLAVIRKGLIGQTYRPASVRRVMLPKSGMVSGPVHTGAAAGDRTMDRDHTTRSAAGLWPTKSLLQDRTGGWRRLRLGEIAGCLEILAGRCWNFPWSGCGAARHGVFRS